MEIPSSLPFRVYLLALDPVKQRLTSRDRIGLTLRAAALTDLYLRGQLTDDNGRPKATGTPITSDPLLADLLQLIAGNKPMAWHRWIGKRESHFAGLVRDRLVQQGIIRVEPYRVLGIFPAKHIIVRQSRIVSQLRDIVTHTLRDGTPVARVDRRDAVTAALAAAGKLRRVIDRKHSRDRKHRIDQLSEVAGPVIPALHKAIRYKQAASEG